MDTTIKSKKEKLFEKYLAESRIFILDGQPVSRSRLIRLLKELGAREENIIAMSDYNEALEKLDLLRPRIILCDFKLTNGSGFDLLHEYKKINPDDRDQLFILLSSDSCQSLVAQAAEENVDSFILKPFTLDVLKATLISTAIDKLYPSPYIQKIEQGKELLFGGKAKESISLFVEAKQLHNRPTLACFYIGQAELISDSLNGAQSSFTEGLLYNKIHYKCLVSLFDLFYELKKYDEAYDVVKTISQFFPANPERLATVLKLAVQTNNFEDVEGYYELFAGLEEQTEKIFTYICAALVVCGRFYFQNNQSNKALGIFKKLAQTTSGNPKFLRIGIENLIEFGHLKEAKDFLEQFSPNTHDGEDYQIASYLVLQTNDNAISAVNNAIGMISKGMETFGLYLVLIRRALESGQLDKASQYLQDGLKLWPDKQALHKIRLEHFPQIAP